MNLKPYVNLRGLVFIIILCSTAAAQQSADSTFWSLSLPELQSYKTYYVQKLEELQEMKYNLIQRGIADGEKLLEKNPDPEIVDEILIRLATLYYYKEKEDYLSEMDRFTQQLTLYSEGRIDTLPDEPRPDYSKSLTIYQRIIDEFPKSSLIPDAIYNQGFIYEEMGDHERANQIYLHLISSFPKSKYVPEAYMRLGEYFFNPPVNDLEKAINYYKSVLNYPTSNRYNEAVYKLGWSYFRLSQYPQAISYFTSLVEDIQKSDLEDKTGQTDLRDESIEYIAISFIDFGGPQNAKKYLQEIGNPEWGITMLEKLGDIYKNEKEEYLEAIKTYRILLNMAEDSPKAPEYQQNIVECYYILEDSENLFKERQKLFLSYKPESDWWNKVSDEKAKLNGYKYSEEALRLNINTLIKKATDSPSDSLYREAVRLGRMYLDVFPEDLYAYTIRWNIALIMDTRLHNYKDALKEYLTITMVYNSEKYKNFAREKGLATIKDAAENAIVVADSLVQREGRRPSLEAKQRGNPQERSPVPLSVSESWLAMAYDNYLKLFPFDTNTPTILANAGALYYTHNQFREALKYFKTLIKYFPESEEINNVRYYILESYLGKKDYDSAEILAKKIIREVKDPGIKRKARERLAEAIFFRAQGLEESGNDSLAANEYFRVAVEVPTASFVDRALFNAARSYEQIGDYSSAIRAYERLMVSHSSSDLIPDVLNNLAFDYGEIGDYQKGGERYKALSELPIEKERARDALYNAYLFYCKAGNITRAIETGRSYAERYPDSEDADRVFFNSGEFCQKLNRDDEAVEIFKRFKERFPSSPLSVEACLRIGRYYYEKGEEREAEKYLNEAIAMNDSLKSSGMEENGYSTAEALYFINKMLTEKYKKISFKLPEEDLKRSIIEKQLLRDRIIDNYTRIIGYATARMVEAIYRIGEVHEDFARSWANQQLPPMDPTMRAVKEKQISAKSVEIYREALNSYRKAIPVFERIIEEAQKDSAGSDTLISTARAWEQKTKEKVSEMLYMIAEVNARTIERLLAAPIPQDLGTIARLEYESQLLLRAIKPLVDEAISAHARNIGVGDTLQLNNRWIKLSKERIVLLSSLLGDKFARLSLEALGYFNDAAEICREIGLSKGEMVSQDTINTMINFIEISESYAEKAVDLVVANVDQGSKMGVEERGLVEIENKMVDYILALADTLGRMIDLSFKDQKEAEVLFEQKGTIQYEDLLALFEDNVYYLKEYLKSILERAYLANKDFKYPSTSGEWIGVRLVSLDPDTYSKKLKIPVARFAIRLDSTWRYSWKSEPGWKMPEFKGRDWKKLKSQSESGDGLIHIFYDSTNAETDSLFICRHIRIPGYPIRSTLTFSSDRPSRIYMNGVLINKNKNTETNPLVYHLKIEDNLLALVFSDKNEYIIGGEWIVRYIPKRVLPNKGVNEK